MDDLSRLSLDLVKTEEVRRLCHYKGVRLIGVSDGTDSAAEGNEMLSGIKGVMNQGFLSDLRKKTHRGLKGQALKGNNCGGRVYGYRPVPVEHPTELDEYGRPRILAVKREIDQEQATRVRQIYRWYADRWSPRDIADEPNRRQVPAPGAAYRRAIRSRHYGTWTSAVLRGDLQHATGLLSNPIYIGQAIWNRREWVLNPETGRRVPRLRPHAEWIETDQPHLRIISPALWEAVRQRHAAQALGPQANGILGAGRNICCRAF
ncbi:MAG: recombinase family protein [Nitrospiraceae bacterium]